MKKIAKAKTNQENMKQKFALAILITLTVTSSALARVGEKWEDVEKRYGHQVFTKLTDPFGNHQFAYEFHDFLVVVTYVNQRSEAEEFTKKNTGELITPKEIDTILNANAPDGATWKSDNLLGWESSDGSLKALHVFNVLQIGTKDYTEQIARFHKAEEAKKLQGF